MFGIYIHSLKPSNFFVCLTHGKSINLKNKQAIAASVCVRLCVAGGAEGVEFKQNMQLNVANCGISFGEVALSSVCGVPDSVQGVNCLGA